MGGAEEEDESDEDDDEPSSSEANDINVMLYKQLLALLLRLGFNPMKLFAKGPVNASNEEEMEYIRGMYELCSRVMDLFRLYSPDRPSTDHATDETNLAKWFSKLPKDLPYLPPAFYFILTTVSHMVDRYQERDIYELVLESANSTEKRSYVFFCKVALQLGAHWWNSHNLPPVMHIQDDAALEPILTAFVQYGVLPSRRRDHDGNVQPIYDFEASAMVQAANFLTFNAKTEEEQRELLQHYEMQGKFGKLTADELLDLTRDAGRSFDVLRNAYDTLSSYSYTNYAVQLFMLNSEQDEALWEATVEQFTLFIADVSLDACHAYLRRYGDVGVQHITSIEEVKKRWCSEPAVNDQDTDGDLKRKRMQLNESLLAASQEEQLILAVLLGLFCEDASTLEWARFEKNDGVLPDYTGAIEDMAEIARVAVKRDLACRLVRDIPKSDVPDTLVTGMYDYPAVHMKLLDDTGTVEDYNATDLAVNKLDQEVYRRVHLRVPAMNPELFPLLILTEPELDELLRDAVSTKREREDDDEEQRPEKRARFHQLLESHARFGDLCDVCNTRKAELVHVKTNVVLCGSVCHENWTDSEDE
jgi:hypothetical protein